MPVGARDRLGAGSLDGVHGGQDDGLRCAHSIHLKEHLMFTGEDSPMANLMLSVMGAFAEFDRSASHGPCGTRNKI